MSATRAAHAVTVVEVSPRDGLQNERATLPTGDKLGLIARAVAAGARRIEAVSFVSPSRVPQMADAEAVMGGVERRPDVSYAGLVLNRRGLERAAASGVDEANAVVVASETFSRRNQGTGTQDSLDMMAELRRVCEAHRIRFTVTIAAAFGCPFEGEVPAGRVAGIARALRDAGAEEIALADTIGVGVPTEIERRIALVRAAAPDVPLRAHLHDTRNTALANAYAAWRAGVSVFDSSIGGTGGCPFAPRATGNVATEDLAWMFARMGAPTGLDIPRLVDAARFLEERLGRPVSGAVGRVDPFPPATDKDAP